MHETTDPIDKEFFGFLLKPLKHHSLDLGPKSTDLWWFLERHEDMNSDDMSQLYGAWPNTFQCMQCSMSCAVWHIWQWLLLCHTITLGICIPQCFLFFSDGRIKVLEGPTKAFCNDGVRILEHHQAIKLAWMKAWRQQFQHQIRKI